MLAPFCRILLNESIWASYLKFFVANATLFIVFAVLSFVIRMKMFRMEKKFMFSERGSKYHSRQHRVQLDYIHFCFAADLPVAGFVRTIFRIF